MLASHFVKKCRLGIAFDAVSYPEGAVWADL